jgi:uncharacterized protein
MTHLPIEISEAQIQAFCKKWKVKEFALFGSVLRDDFGPNSDIDVLLTYAPDATWSLFDLVDIIEELETIFHRKVDVVNRKAVERSRNPYRRQAILESAQIIHAA